MFFPRFPEYITNHEKKLKLSLVKYDFKIIFKGGQCYQILCGLESSLPIFLKRFFLVEVNIFFKEDINFPIYLKRVIHSLVPLETWTIKFY